MPPLCRRGMQRRRFSVPPKLARRFALSSATSASRPRRTNEVFSFTPVISVALRSIRSSILSVVRIKYTQLRHIPARLFRANASVQRNRVAVYAERLGSPSFVWIIRSKATHAGCFYHTFFCIAPRSKRNIYNPVAYLPTIATFPSSLLDLYCAL